MFGLLFPPILFPAERLGLGGAIRTDGTYLSALEVKSLVQHRIPGLDLILDPIIDAIVSPIFAGFNNEGGKDLIDEISNKMTASVGGKVPQQTADHLVHTLSKNVTNLLTGTFVV